MASASFYTLQASNRRKSWLLLVSVALLFGVFGFAAGFGTTGDPIGGLGFTIAAVLFAVLLSAGSYYSGDALVLKASGARELAAADAPQLLNIVEELRIASDLPMPRVYLIDDSAPNAFATGRDPEHASIAVTSGLIDRLNREELQGVIAHELSHVRNLDIRFALLIGVLVGGIALLADMLLRYTFFFGGRGRRNDRGGGGAAQVIVLVLALVLAIVAPIAARAVQFAVSRQREYLADASAVELTRNPQGLEVALAKIATDTEVLEVANRSTQHMYIINPIKKFEDRSRGLFSTHPPIVDRVNRLRGLRGAAALDESTSSLLAALD